MKLGNELIEEISKITEYDYSELKDLTKEERLEIMLNDMLEAYELLTDKYDDLDEQVEEYGLNYPSYEEEISYSHSW